MCYALNAIGCSRTEEGEDGTPELELSLQTALDAGLQKSVGHVYTSLQESAVTLHRFEDADRYYAAGSAYCEDRELGVYATCLRGGRAWGLLLRGMWDEAITLTAKTLSLTGISPVNRLNPLRVQGAIRARRGDSVGWDMLDEAIVLAEKLADAAWIIRSGRCGRSCDGPQAPRTWRRWRCWPAKNTWLVTTTLGRSGLPRSGSPG